ncbi:MAG: alpha-L-arabinofuranosidase [Acidobacteria bacterium]|nr:alpha-L-arabinofuranosidase [Acidobacteriota bacterium]
MAAGIVRPASGSASASIVVDPRPLFDISPHLYMQFMEPLGTTDGSVEAAWDYDIDDWRPDLIRVAKDLSPDVIRWGGNFITFYRWREGVGPVSGRRPMYNYAWGGKESNRVGTREFVDFCRRTGARPLICVNLLSEGIAGFRKTVHNEDRAGDAAEAADWVSYSNDPDSRERKQHGDPEPYNIGLWQLGNETSYKSDGFSRDEYVRRLVEFARAMKRRDPSISLIGWGDATKSDGEDFWAPHVLERAGEYLSHVAVHMMNLKPRRADTVLRGFEYQKAPEQAWEELLDLTRVAENKLLRIKEIVRAAAPRVGLAITEGHLSLRPHNVNPILQEWLTGVFHARILNLYQRHGDTVAIATAADFCGTRWTVNAVMMPVPARRGRCYLLPVGSVMRLFKRHYGKAAMAVIQAPASLDIAASGDENRVFLHVANMNYSDGVETDLSVRGRSIAGGRIREIAPGDPRAYVDAEQPDVFCPVEKKLPAGSVARWRFPRASVSVVELDLAVSGKRENAIQRGEEG